MSTANLIYENNKDAIITVSSRDPSGEKIEDYENSLINNSIFGTGWIQNIVDDRIIVITCAHLILQSKGLTYPTKNNISISCTVTNAIRKGQSSKDGRNIAVSLKILGLDISADIAVLYSLKDGEQDDENPFTFDFSTRNKTLKWGSSNNILFGSNVYVISNAYGTGLNMATGTIIDPDLVFRSLDPTYPNPTSQIISSVDVAGGSSGGPLFSEKGEVIGIIAWRKLDDNYVGGSNEIILQKSYNKIRQLNLIENECNQKYIPDRIGGLNFEGRTGKGYLGISSYFAVTDQTLKLIIQQYPKFADSQYSNSTNGIVIFQFSGMNMVIPKSGVLYAKNNETGVREGLSLLDIILSIDDISLGVYDKGVSLDDFSYYKAGSKVQMKVLRPSTNKIMYFTVLVGEYPNTLEYVSQSNSIRLIAEGLPLNNLFANGVAPFPLRIKFGTFNTSAPTPPAPYTKYATSFTVFTDTFLEGETTININVNPTAVPPIYGYPIVESAQYAIQYVVILGVSPGNGIHTFVTPVIYPISSQILTPSGYIQLSKIPLIIDNGSDPTSPTPILTSELTPGRIPQTYTSSSNNNPFPPLGGAPNLPGSVPFVLQLTDIQGTQVGTGNTFNLLYYKLINQALPYIDIMLGNVIVPNGGDFTYINYDKDTRTPQYIVKYITVEKEKVDTNTIPAVQVTVCKIKTIYLQNTNGGKYFVFTSGDPFHFLGNMVASTYSLPLPNF